MRKYAIVIFGGNSYEHDISIVSAIVVMKELDKCNIDYIPIYISYDGIMYTGDALKDKSNYSSKKKFEVCNIISNGTYYFFKSRMRKYYVDYIIPIVHGKGIEDGTLASLLEITNLPYGSSSLETSCILQNKYLTKLILKTIDINVCPFVILNKDNYLQKISKLNKEKEYIIKPNSLGSSIGVLASSYEKLKDDILKCLKYENDILVEEKLDNLIEYINKKNNTILSFKDKYEEFSLSNEKKFLSTDNEILRKEIYDIAIKVFKKFNCRGIVRFDFLFDGKNKVLYFNEANTIPGSLSLYLFERAGFSSKEIFLKLKNISFIAFKEKNLHFNVYSESNLNKINTNKY